MALIVNLTVVQTGAVLLIYNPYNSQLSTTPLTDAQTTAPGASTSAPSILTSAPSTCSNPFRGRVVRAAGDFQPELGSPAPWLATEANSLMTLDEASCLYLLVLSGLTPSKFYEWKVTLDNAWSR